jgi:hypothetical protein
MDATLMPSATRRQLVDLKVYCSSDTQLQPPRVVLKEKRSQSVTRKLSQSIQNILAYGGHCNDIRAYH